jgi:hypothetical protein
MATRSSTAGRTSCSRSSSTRSSETPAGGEASCRSPRIASRGDCRVPGAPLTLRVEVPQRFVARQGVGFARSGGFVFVDESDAPKLPGDASVVRMRVLAGDLGGSWRAAMVRAAACRASCASRRLPAPDREFLAQDEYVQRLRTTRSREQPEEREHLPHDEKTNDQEQPALDRPHGQERPNLARPESRGRVLRVQRDRIDLRHPQRSTLPRTPWRPHPRCSACRNLEGRTLTGGHAGRGSLSRARATR